MSTHGKAKAIAKIDLETESAIAAINERYDISESVKKALRATAIATGEAHKRAIAQIPHEHIDDSGKYNPPQVQATSIFLSVAIPQHTTAGDPCKEK